MRLPRPFRTARTVRLRYVPPRRVRDCEFRFATLVGTASFGFLLAMPLFTLFVPDSLAEGHGLLEALWLPNTRNLTISVAVCVLLFAVLSVVYTFGVPRTLTRRAIKVGDAGIVVIERPVWRFTGPFPLIGWEDVRAIDASTPFFREGPQLRSAMRAVLDIHLLRDVPGLPSFAACERVDTPGLLGAGSAAYRVRIGGPGRLLQRDVHRLAGTLQKARPDLWRGFDAASNDASGD